jgi:RsiW-degrading membrane proteinase PrsW (M82 family)
MKILLGSGAVFALPLMALAQASNLTDVFNSIFEFINYVVIPFIFALAFIWFLWNVFQYFFFTNKPSNEALRDQILFSVIGLFVMLSIWGIVALVQNSLLGSSGSSTPPTLPVLETNAP